MSVYAEIDASNAHRITVQTEYRHKELIKQLPGSAYNPKLSVWTMPLGWAGCLALRSQFGDELEIGPELYAWSMKEYNERIVPCMELRQALDAPGPASLYSYQRAGVEFLARAERALLADEMGTGKTRQALSTLLRLYQDGKNPFPALIICPNSTKISWQREAEAVWPGITATVVKGSAAQRRKQLETPAHIYIMNWESVRGHSRLAPYGDIALKRCIECGGTDPGVSLAACEVHLRELNHINFSTVIADEVHRAKDPKAKQTRAFWAATGEAGYRYGLSGTPIASSPEDLWPILHWLSPLEWPSKVKYMDRFCDISYNAYGQTTVIGIKHWMEKEFFGALDPRLRRMPKALVLSHLPPVRYERRHVEMGPKQKKAYTQMRDQMLAVLENDEVYQTTSALTVVMRMLQFAAAYGEVYQKWNEKKQKFVDAVKLIEPSSKLDAFMNDLDDFGDDSVIVFAVSKQLINLLSARLTKQHIPHGLITGDQDADERQKHMDDFQAGKTKFILCTIAAGGTGITLTKARIAVFLQRDWSMINNYQAEGRNHRIGSEQHDSILVIDYVTTDTIEDVVIAAVERKSQQLERILRDKELIAKAVKAEAIEHKPEDEVDIEKLMNGTAA